MEFFPVLSYKRFLQVSVLETSVNHNQDVIVKFHTGMVDKECTLAPNGPGLQLSPAVPRWLTFTR